jgi:galactokinase
VRRTSSRFCFGVEHGDYNNLELFGVGTDRFIWIAYKPNTIGRIRIFSENMPDEGLVDFS